jgi:hypothetical protein
MSGWAVANVRWTLIWGRDAEKLMIDLGAGVGPGWQGRRQNGLTHCSFGSQSHLLQSQSHILGGSLMALYGANFSLNLHSTPENTHLLRHASSVPYKYVNIFPWKNGKMGAVKNGNMGIIQ